MSDLEAPRDAMREFTAERDWERFHGPKSLLLYLVRLADVLGVGLASAALSKLESNTRKHPVDSDGSGL